MLYRCLFVAQSRTLAEESCASGLGDRASPGAFEPPSFGKTHRMQDAVPPRPDQRVATVRNHDGDRRPDRTSGPISAGRRPHSPRAAPVTPVRPDMRRGAAWPTWAALLLALATIAMASPAFIDAFAWPGEPQLFSPTGWRRDLWLAASAVALASFVLALVRAPIERRRRSRAGRWAVDVTFYLLVIAAMLWLLPLLGVLGNGP
jgi:hypothetical protein